MTVAIISAVALVELATIAGLLYADHRRDYMAAELRRLTAPLPEPRQRLSDLPAVHVDRADGMDDVLGRQPVALGDLRVAGLAAIELHALEVEVGAGRSMDRAIDTSATEERLVRRVDDGVDGEGRDVPLDHLDARHI
jgi:hypothetical protein